MKLFNYMHFNTLVIMCHQEVHGSSANKVFSSVQCVAFHECTFTDVKSILNVFEFLIISGFKHITTEFLTLAVPILKNSFFLLFLCIYSILQAQFRDCKPKTFFLLFDLKTISNQYTFHNVKYNIHL
jgi:hypothetical protein